MRLRGVARAADEGGGMAERMESAFNEVGITLFETDDQIKSTYDILHELSTVWEDITDVQRAYILELVAGKQFFAPLYGNI